MPTYSYRCDTCGHQFDASQRFSEDPLTECPECGASIRRVIQPVGIVFKGSGWYVNDSRAPQKEAGGAEAKPAATKDGGEAKEAAPEKEKTTKETSAPATTTTEKPAAKAAAD